ncbi:MAG: hypothetical protein GY869_17605, partial [Planctomycetes bacterium]|nr:hypothetical protein [Planctomycetota bacterium]
MRSKTVKFILGRSGSGKTYCCLESIKQQLQQASQGVPLILLVPEQATFQMEQALLASDEFCGYHRAHVVSFARLARLVLMQTEPPSQSPLGDRAKQMILRRLLQEKTPQLTVFARSADKPGFIAQLSRMISELRQYQKDPQHLHDQKIQLIQKNTPVLKPLIEKLTDLELIYQGYLDYISERFIDPDDYLDLLRPRCRRAEILQNARLWVDGFAGFTPQQYAVLKALADTVDRIELTLCLDPHSPQCGIAESERENEVPFDDLDLFHPTLLTYQRLNRLFSDKTGFSAEKLISPPAQKPTDNISFPRFNRSTSLAQLENNLFRGELSPSPSVSPDKPVTSEEIPCNDIVIVAADQRRREVEAVAAHILKLCREHNYRFGDIAVILRDFSDYQDLLEATFANYGIACFLDQRRPVRCHPLIELIGSALQVVARDFRTEDVLNYLKTDLAPLSRSAADTLENYVLTHGIQTNKWYDEQPWRYRSGSPDLSSEVETESDLYFTAEQLNQLRHQALAGILDLRGKLYGAQFQPEKSLSVLEITTAVVQLLEEIEVPQTLSQWTHHAQLEKKLALMQTHQQVYADIVALLDDLVQALGDVHLTIGQYAEILTASLNQMSLALVPPALDQVLIGAIERSRHPKIKAAFVLGVNQGRFPCVMAPDAFFTDTQREELSCNDFELAPNSTERLLHERYLAYIAFTRPSDFLWVSYSVADEKGAALNPSSLIKNIQNAVAHVPAIHLGQTCQSDINAVDHPCRLGRQLALALSAADTSKENDHTCRQLYHYGLERPDWKNIIQGSLAGLTYQNNACLDKENIEGWLGDKNIGSVSRLESLAACPFQHFARYLLKLAPRDELKLAAVDVGSVYHKVLHLIFLKMSQQKMNWRTIAEDELNQVTLQVIEHLYKKDPQIAALLGQSHRNKHMLTEATRHLQRLVQILKKAASVGDFCQQHAELEFGPGKSIPAYKINLPDDRQFWLRGKIDRVDFHFAPDNGQTPAAIMIIDYKSTQRSFPFTDFYHGLSLQLLTYLLVLHEHYQSEGQPSPQPAAALYVPVHPQGKIQTGPPPEEILNYNDSDSFTETIQQATGVINENCCPNLDRTVKPKEKSNYYRFKIKKDGSVS